MKSRTLRSALLAGTGTALITGFAATPAYADPTVNQSSTNSITVQQEFNDFSTPGADVTLDGNTNGTVNVVIANEDEASYALQNSTVTVGSSLTTGNVTSASGYANSADLTVNANLNNVVGSGISTIDALSSDSVAGATVHSSTDIGVALTQQNIGTVATVSDSTDLGVTLDNGATASIVTIAGNRQSATGVLNSGTTSIDASANNSSGSSGVGVSQSSVDAALAVSVSSQASFTTGSGTSGIALNNSTAKLADNSQTATAVANSGSNAQAVSGNELVLAADSAETAQATTDTFPRAGAIGGYATASNQELAGGALASVSATVSDAAGVGGYLATIDGDVVGSTLNNDRNSASALARGNEVVNTTAIDANGIFTDSRVFTESGTVAAIASQQNVTGIVTIAAAVTGGGVDGPMVSNVITGDVGPSSSITASGNSVLANAAGNRGGNAITASATTIDTRGTDLGSAQVAESVGVADAAFAVANRQTVSSGSTITAGLVDDVTAPTAGTSISTAIGGSVLNSSVASLGNSLTAAVAGNQSLAGGNAITLAGTNVATSAAVSSIQEMGGVLTATIGSEGTAAVPAGTESFTFNGSSSGGTFTGTALGDAADAAALNDAYALGTFTHDAGIITFTVPDALNEYTTFPASYSTGGSAGSPASGGVVVTVGNDITNSSIDVNGNATSGSATGNSGTNRIVATATNLANATTIGSAVTSIGEDGVVATAEMAVANSQSVGLGAELTSTVGAVFGIAEGIADPALSDVNESTLSVSGNSASSALTGNAAGNLVQLTAGTLSNTSALANSQQMGGELRADMANFSGAFAVVGRDVTSSSVLVDGNEFSGTAFGNDAANTVAVAGSSAILRGDANPNAVTDPSDVALGSLARADHSLVNVQGLQTGATLVTEVIAEYGISTLGVGAPVGEDDTSDIANSTLSVSDNVQSAMTTGNNASNGVSITGGAIATNGALQSVQTSDAGVITASSAMLVGAPAANTMSTLSLNGNDNSASATVNSATNSMVVAAATNLDGSSAYYAGGSPTDDYSATADYAVNNLQTVGSGSVVSNAYTIIGNNDGGVFADEFTTDGIQQSTVDLIGNTTQASATSNRSANALNLSANSTDASAAVLNQQANAAGVSSTAIAFVATDVTGYAVAPAASPMNASALTIAGNATTARAGGNTTTNALNVSATNFANVATSGTTSLNANRSDTVVANFAVLNEQGNTGAISAVANVTYGAGFDALGVAPSATNSAVMVNGNSAGSVAYGNAATNQMTFAALNSPVEGSGRTITALASNQVNTGNIGASTVANIGAFAAGNGGVTGGAVSMSSVSVNGNALSVSAFGNSSTNTVTISGNNINVGGAILQP